MWSPTIRHCLMQRSCWVEQPLSEKSCLTQMIYWINWYAVFPSDCSWDLNNFEDKSHLFFFLKKLSLIYFPFSANTKRFVSDETHSFKRQNNNKFPPIGRWKITQTDKQKNRQTDKQTNKQNNLVKLLDKETTVKIKKSSWLNIEGQIQIHKHSSNSR